MFIKILVVINVIINYLIFMFIEYLFNVKVWVLIKVYFCKDIER